MPVAYSYVRFSTIEQKKGDSLRRQTEMSEAYAKQHGLTLDTSLHLQDLGLSAYDRSNIERGALGGFLEAIKQGRIAPGSYLLVESLDRLSRDKVLDALNIFISILNKGITIVTLADAMVYNTETVGNNFGNLIISITIMARAHEESVMKSRRVKAAWTGKRGRIQEKKLTGRCPLWMRLNKEKNEFELVPERVEIVKEIIGLIKSGMGQSQIARILNERKVPQFSNHGKGWHSSYIQKLATSTALYGEYQPNLWENNKVVPIGDPVPNYYPALITKEDFHLIQNIRHERMKGGGKAKKGTVVPNILSGIVKCGYCGSTMILIGTAAKMIRVEGEIKPRILQKKVLLCEGGRRGMNCFAVRWDYKDFEKSFLSFCRTLELEKFLNDVDTATRETARQLTINEKLQSVDSAISEIKKRLERLTAALELGDAPETVLRRIRELEMELEISVGVKEQLTAEIQAVQTSEKYRENEIESVRESIRQLESLSGEKLFFVRAALAEHIRRLIEAVYVYPAGTLNTQTEIERIRTKLRDEGFSEERIESYVAQAYRIEPKRQGKGPQARYASQKDVGRHFAIKSKGGGFRVVYPNFDDPSEVEIEMGIRGG